MTDLAKSSAWISDPVSPRQGGRWDLLVIGGGTAGLVAAKAAAGFGATVLLVEKDRTGGDCLWTGCVPSKTLLSAAHTAALARRAGRYGVTVTGVEVWVLTALPERLLVLGGGSIGGELGQAFARLGSSDQHRRSGCHVAGRRRPGRRGAGDRGADRRRGQRADRGPRAEGQHSRPRVVRGTGRRLGGSAAHLRASAALVSGCTGLVENSARRIQANNLTEAPITRISLTCPLYLASTSSNFTAQDR